MGSVMSAPKKWGVLMVPLCSLTYVPHCYLRVKVGLEGSGKKTLLRRLKMGQCVTVIPTMGFNVNIVANDKVEFRALDVGGDDRFRPLYNLYYERVSAVIFVVNVSQAGRVNLDRAVDEFHILLHADGLRDAPILVVAHQTNKHGSAPTASELDELQNKLKQHRRVTDWTEAGVSAFLMGTHSQGSALLRLRGNSHVLEQIWGFVKPLEIISYEEVLQGRPWRLQLCEYHMDGLYEGLDWLDGQLKGTTPSVE